MSSAASRCPLSIGVRKEGTGSSSFGAGTSLLAAAGGTSVPGNTLVSASLKSGGHSAAHEIVHLSWLWVFSVYMFVFCCCCFPPNLALFCYSKCFLPVHWFSIRLFEMYKLISNCENHNCISLRLIRKKFTSKNCLEKEIRKMFARNPVAMIGQKCHPHVNSVLDQKWRKMTLQSPAAGARVLWWHRLGAGRLLSRGAGFPSLSAQLLAAGGA